MNQSKWEVVHYEIEMLENLQKIKLPLIDENSLKTLKNAIAESMVLHTRILIDIIISKGFNNDDIFLKDLIPGYQSDYIEKLKVAYGSNNKKDSPCWEFNKLLAHATSNRSTGHDYSPSLSKVIPLIEKIIIDIKNHNMNKI